MGRGRLGRKSGSLRFALTEEGLQGGALNVTSGITASAPGWVDSSPSSKVDIGRLTLLPALGLVLSRSRVQSLEHDILDMWPRASSAEGPGVWTDQNLGTKEFMPVRWRGQSWDWKLSS